MGHVLMENRNDLIVQTQTTIVIGTAERATAIAMIENLPGGGRTTLGADEADNTADFSFGAGTANAARCCNRSTNFT
jgi:hypothetical protein